MPLSKILLVVSAALSMFWAAFGNAAPESTKPSANSAVQSQSSSASSASVWLDVPLTPSDARHLLSRTGFSADPEQQRLLAGLSRRDAIAVVMRGFSVQPEIDMPAWTRETAPLYWTRRDLNPTARRQFDRTRDAELGELRQWWIDEMLTTTSPQTERMVLFWHDHFATSYHAINRQSIAMARQNQTFRELGMGDFRTLLQAMIRDPALLNFLDNENNQRTSPNENLARELLELFTLGEGNFTENTVREVARSLTGYSTWENRNLSFRFKPWHHDSGNKTVFGETGAFDGDDVIDILLQQPELDRHIAARYWHWLIADTPPPAADLAALGKRFRDSGHRLDALYRATLESNAFWHIDHRAGLVKSPVNLIIGTARALETPKRINHQIPKWLRQAGQDLFAPLNVAGWSEGAAWITPGKLLNRYAAIDALLQAAARPQADQSDAQNVSGNNMMAPTNSMMSTASEPTPEMATEMAPEQMLAKESMTPSAKTETLLLQLASEEYKGAANYRVELLDQRADILWSSGNRRLVGGWDTMRNGAIQSRDQLLWQLLSFDVEASLLPQAERVRVHFTNDAAGADGDRNLYVGKLRLQQHWYDVEPNSQRSKCAPENPADAADLYCRGWVDVSLTTDSAMTTDASDEVDASDAIRYASMHVYWSNANVTKDTADVRLVFQDLRLGERHWPVFGTRYSYRPDQPVKLVLNNFDCWPDCLERWPSCASVDAKTPTAMSISIPLPESVDDKPNACASQALTQAEAELVDSLLLNAESLMKIARATEQKNFPDTRMQVKRALDRMLKELSSAPVRSILSKRTATAVTALHDVPTLTPDPFAKRASGARASQRRLPIRAASLTARQRTLQRLGFTWQTVLAPGLPVQTLPGWQATAGQQEAASVEQLRQWLHDPAYQVH